jgi:RNA polymerase-binding protein DksA
VAKQTPKKSAAAKKPSKPAARKSTPARPAAARPAGAARPAPAAPARQTKTARSASVATTAKSRPAAPRASAPAAAPAAASRRPAPGRITPQSRPFAAPAPRFAPPIQMQPPPVPVPTNGKPRKNQAGMNSRELEHFRDLLLQKRREIVGDMSQMEREALRSTSGGNLSNLPLHMADMGTDNYEQEFTLGLVEKDRVILREINSALAKIMDGSYGICEGTGKPISKVRLEAQPWARFSIEYARQMEKGFLR